jgi:hypothetical protein
MSPEQLTVPHTACRRHVLLSSLLLYVSIRLHNQLLKSVVSADKNNEGTMVPRLVKKFFFFGKQTFIIILTKTRFCTTYWCNGTRSKNSHTICLRFISHFGSRDSSVSIMTQLVLEDRGTGIRHLVRAEVLVFSTACRTTL